MSPHRIFSRTLAVVIGVSILCIPQLMADPAHAALSVDDIWLYAPFDNSAEPLIGEHTLQTTVQQWSSEGEIGGEKGTQPELVDGVSGKGIVIRQPEEDRNGTTLSYYSEVGYFPRESGSIMFWYKPLQPLSAADQFLYSMGWCNFQAQISYKRLLAYATSSAKHFVAGPLRPTAAEPWQDTWQLITVTWDRKQVDAYLNSTRVASSATVEPLHQVNYLMPSLGIGSLLPSGTRKVPVAYANGVFDDLVVLAVPLNQTQIAEVYQAGKAEGFGGYLSLFGDSALVTMPRHAWLRGEKTTLTVNCYGAAEKGKLIGADAAGTAFILSEFNPADQTVELSIPTANLRPGKYRVWPELYRSGKKTSSGKATPLVINARRQPDFPVGLGGSFGLPADKLSVLESLPLSFLTSNGPQGDLLFARQLDRAFSHGLCLLPNFNVISVWTGDFDSLKKEPYFQLNNGKMEVNPEQGWLFLQTLKRIDGAPDHNRMTSSASPFSPIAWEMMSARVGQIMDLAGDSPALWMVSFQDEVPLRRATVKEDGESVVKVGDYSYYAVEYFKKKSGLENPVFPPFDKPGTVWPDDHPYLKWMTIIGLPGSNFTSPAFDNLYHRLAQEVKQRRPDVLAANYSGSEFGKLDRVLDWNYSSIWGQNGAWQTDRGVGLLDYIFDRHWAVQRERPRKPLGALLGWWTSDLSKVDDWCAPMFNIDTALALAKGNKQISWFGESGLFSHPGLQAALERWCSFLHTKGPLFAKLEKRPSRKTAVLWSRINRAGHVQHTGAQGIYGNVFSGLRNCGANPDLITDSLIMEGELEKYQALVLCGFNFSSENLWAKISAFAKTPGKAVFHDNASELFPESSIPLKADYSWFEYGSIENAEAWAEPLKERAGLENVKRKDMDHNVKWRNLGVPIWAKHLESIVMPKLPQQDLEILNSTGQISPFLLWSENTPVLMMVNLDVDRERKALVRFKHSGRVAYDIDTGEVLRLKPDAERVRFPVSLRPGAWKAYLLPDREMAQIGIAATVKNGNVTVRYAINDTKGNAIRTAWPLRIELLDPAGVKTTYLRQTATDESGTGTLAFALGKLTDPAGAWQVVATDELTGKKSSASVTIRW